MVKNQMSGYFRALAKEFKTANLPKAFKMMADELDRLETENAELRQKAENNQTCYVSEAAWAERVGQILKDKSMQQHNWVDDETAILIPNEILEDLLVQYKALGHSLTVEGPCQ